MLTDAQKVDQVALLKVCFEKQGEYLNAGQPSGSWSTRYGNEFIEAASYLFLLHARTSRYPEYSMSRAFIAAGVNSCRGTLMDDKRVKYLIAAHITRFLSARGILPKSKLQ